MAELLTLSYRTAILYLVALAVFRMMGKRTLAKMGPFDFAVVIMIGESVALGMENTKSPLINAIGITVALGLLQYLLTWVNVRWRLLEKITQGIPTRIVYQGRAEDKQLLGERVSHADLMMELRQQNVDNLSQVEEAFLEPTGKISVKKKSSSSSSSSASSKASGSSSTSSSQASGSQSSSDQNATNNAQPSSVASSRSKRTFKAPKKIF